MDDPRAPRKIVKRLEDMEIHGSLTLVLRQDGDILLFAEQDTFGDGEVMVSARIGFCSTVNGGGGSPHTFKALLNLIEAIEKDNQINPHRAG